MSSRIVRMLCVQIFGESHGPAVGVTLDGLPAGLPLDMEALEAFLQRRAARGAPSPPTGAKATVPAWSAGF